jgi:hypothetical protein
MSIPYGIDYTVTLSGSVLKVLRCEQCGTEYGYQMTRSAQGGGTSLLFLDNQGAQDRAAQAASARLVAKLENSCDPVPCPQCGWYQAEMIPRVRRLRYRWLQNTGIALFPISAFLVMAAAIIHAANERQARLPVFVWVFWGVVILGFLAAIALLILYYRLSARYDPNREDVEHRKRAGLARALTGTSLAQARRPAGTT